MLQKCKEMGKSVKTSDYITLAEAAARTGKSEMTIRRLTKQPIANKYIMNTKSGILISSSFVNSKYPHGDNGVKIINENVNIDNKIASNVNKNVNSIEIDTLLAKIEGKDKLLAIQQQHIDRLEKQFSEYREEKQRELDRLHDKWSQEQEIFKRDQHLNAGKYIIQKNQEFPETSSQEVGKSIWKRLFG